MTSQTAHTKYKWPPMTLNQTPSMKIFCVRHCLPPCGPPSSRPTFPDLMSAISGTSPWTTDGKKTLPNSRSTAPKQDEVHVQEVWSSCVQGTPSNFLLTPLKRKRCMHFVFCCIAHFNVATVWKRFVCKRCGYAYKNLDQLRLWENSIDSTFASLIPCCYFVKGALTQNKRCRYCMFEFTLFFLFLIDSMQQISRCYRKGVCPVWAKHTLWAGIYKNVTEIFSWPCCDFVKGVLTQNKHCRHYVFDIGVRKCIFLGMQETFAKILSCFSQIT